TTGSCATSTRLAAARLLLSGQDSDAVEIVLPNGKQVQMRLEFCRVVDNVAEARTHKDPAADPAVPHGPQLFARDRLKAAPR
ncbi:cobalt-precorrin-5B (C(1))-methyltransferase, partial [Pseudomonas syringae pv. tagetis]|uniref:cobalt-precorrin-5B (C(1))-methyltransferase n=1 Tax=Pseudomonas syringae group genomosp. 7 TaxID=251699 RepID=UPI00376F476E